MNHRLDGSNSVARAIRPTHENLREVILIRKIFGAIQKISWKIVVYAR
jgi:hypothetical protein